LKMMRSSEESNEAELGRGMDGDDGSGEQTGDLLGEGKEKSSELGESQKRQKRESRGKRERGREEWRRTATPYAIFLIKGPADPRAGEVTY